MKHVAVIGGGIAGLAAAYLLSRRHRVSLFERAPRLGGHTHTVVVDSPDGPVPLDTGFLVHNERTYPNLVRLFDEIGVETLGVGHVVLGQLSRVRVRVQQPRPRRLLRAARAT